MRPRAYDEAAAAERSRDTIASDSPAQQAGGGVYTMRVLGNRAAASG